MRQFSALVLSWALAVIVLLDPAAAQEASTRVPVPWSEVHQFLSQDGIEYDLYVGLPPEFDPEFTAGYQVLFVLDSPVFFLTLPMVWFLRGSDTPGMIVVGIDKPFETRDQWQARRTLDLTPTSVAEYERQRSEEYGHEVRTGGSDAFLRVLTDEIVPWVEARYPTAPERGLVGFSLGGLFAFHALFSSPDLFSHYLILSPSLYWDGAMMFDKERAYATDHQDLPVRVVIFAGSEENFLMVSNTLRMTEALAAREYEGLEIQSEIIEGETHASLPAVSIFRGLRMLFGSGE